MRTLKFVKNESLTHAMNFGEGPAFPKGPGSLFTKVRIWVRVRFIKYGKMVLTYQKKYNLRYI